MYFLYGAIALWLVGEIAGLIGRIKARVSTNYWIGSTALFLSRALLFYFITKQSFDLGNVFFVIFQNFDMIGTLLSKVGAI